MLRYQNNEEYASPEKGKINFDEYTSPRSVDQTVALVASFVLFCDMNLTYYRIEILICIHVCELINFLLLGHDYQLIILISLLSLYF
jgi:hypothetical protein